MEELEICPLCGEGKLSQQVKTVPYSYKDYSISLDQPGMYCDYCGESILSGKDLKITNDTLEAFRNWVNNLPKESESNDLSVVEVPLTEGFIAKCELAKAEIYAGLGTKYVRRK